MRSSVHMVKEFIVSLTKLLCDSRIISKLSRHPLARHATRATTSTILSFATPSTRQTYRSSYRSLRASQPRGLPVILLNIRKRFRKLLHTALQTDINLLHSFLHLVFSTPILKELHQALQHLLGSEVLKSSGRSSGKLSGRTDNHRTSTSLRRNRARVSETPLISESTFRLSFFHTEVRSQIEWETQLETRAAESESAGIVRSAQTNDRNLWRGWQRPCNPPAASLRPATATCLLASPCALAMTQLCTVYRRPKYIEG